MNGEPHHIKVFNLPQRIEGGIKVIVSKDKVYRFHKMDGVQGVFTVDGTDELALFHGSTLLRELGNDEYQVEEPTEEDKSY